MWILITILLKQHSYNFIPINRIFFFSFKNMVIAMFIPLFRLLLFCRYFCDLVVSEYVNFYGFQSLFHLFLPLVSAYNCNIFSASVLQLHIVELVRHLPGDLEIQVSAMDLTSKSSVTGIFLLFFVCFVRVICRKYLKNI